MDLVVVIVAHTRNKLYAKCELCVRLKESVYEWVGDAWHSNSYINEKKYASGIRWPNNCVYYISFRRSFSSSTPTIWFHVH